MKKFSELTTPELAGLINNKNTKIIDIRPADAYNGWKLNNEKRGGHIKGAKSLPIKWSNYMDWIEIVRSKKILPENKIIVYSYVEKDSLKVAKLFAKAGYTDVSVYNKFTEEWTTNEDLPMEYLARQAVH